MTVADLLDEPAPLGPHALPPVPAVDPAVGEKTVGSMTERQRQAAAALLARAVRRRRAGAGPSRRWPPRPPEGSVRPGCRAARAGPELRPARRSRGCARRGRAGRPTRARRARRPRSPARRASAGSRARRRPPRPRRPRARGGASRRCPGCPAAICGYSRNEISVPGAPLVSAANQKWRAPGSSSLDALAPRARGRARRGRTPSSARRSALISVTWCSPVIRMRGARAAARAFRRPGRPAGSCCGSSVTGWNATRSGGGRHARQLAPPERRRKTLAQRLQREQEDDGRDDEHDGLRRAARRRPAGPPRRAPRWPASSAECERYPARCSRSASSPVASATRIEAEGDEQHARRRRRGTRRRARSSRRGC